MKKHIVLVLLAAACILPRRAEGMVAERIAFPSWTLLPGQQNIVIVGVKTFNDGADAASITSLTVTFSQQTGAIVPGSVRLWNDADGSWATPEDRTVAGSAALSGTKAVFSGLAIPSDPGAAGYLYVSADIATAVHFADKVYGEISGSADITVSSGTVSGTFPLASLDPVSPHCVDIEASALILELSAPRTVAGEPLSFTVSCVDSYGNVDEGWNGAALTLGGTPGSAPGKSGAGRSPVYTGGGAWTAAEKGKKTCSCTLYKIESDRRIRASAGVLGYVDSEPIVVHAGPAARMAISPVGEQTAGAAFEVVVNALDSNGDPVTGYKGSEVTVAGEYGTAASPGGFAPVFPPSSAWNGSEEQGQKKFTVVLYSAGIPAALSAADPLLGKALSNEFIVKPSSPAAFLIEGTGLLVQGTSSFITLTSRDVWGNVPSNFSGEAALSCSDPRDSVPTIITFVKGTAAAPAVMRSAGVHTITITCAEYPSLTGSLALTIPDASALVNRFRLDAPANVRAGAGFAATITALDKDGNVVEGFDGDVTVSVSPSGTMSPSSVKLMRGVWTGLLTVASFAPEVSVTLSNGTLETSALVLKIDAAALPGARAYPTVFSPRRESVRIQYSLRENRDVTIKIYTAVMDLVQEMRFSSGSEGAMQGVNTVEWNGKGGDNDTLGRSGGYHILIDKGYEQEWTGAVIKNY